MSLATTFFNAMEQFDTQQMEAFGRHGGCREAREMDLSKVAPELARSVTMGNQPTVRESVDAVDGTLHEHFASGPTKQRFQDKWGDMEKDKRQLLLWNFWLE